MSKRKRKKRSSAEKGSFFGKYRLWIFSWLVIIAIVSGVGCGAYALVNHAKEDTAKKAVEAAMDATVAATVKAAPEDVFFNTAFVGNSFVYALKTYHFPDYTDFLGRIGLTVETAFTQDLVDPEATILEILEKRPQDYDRMFLVFGENELGWRSSEVFAEKYQELIDAIRKEMPKSKLYVMGILPVTDQASSENKDHANNERINEYNEKLKAMAAEDGITYVSPPTGLMNGNGALKSDASTDGIHPTAEYYKIWIDNLRKLLEEE